MNISINDMQNLYDEKQNKKKTTYNKILQRVIKTMKDKYPELQATESDLTLGAQVLSGEVEWH